VIAAAFGHGFVHEHTVGMGVSKYDVAARAGVSHTTVTRFFRQPELLSPETRDRVERAVRELRYVPNATAQSLRSGQSKTVALGLPDITNPFYTTLARSITDVARQHDYTVILGNTDEDPPQERDFLEMLLSRRVDGLILAPARGGADHLLQLQQHGVPVVLIDRLAPQLWEYSDLVRADTYEGARQLTSHFIEQGFRDIAFVGPRLSLSSLSERLGGYKQAIREAGLRERLLLGPFEISPELDHTAQLLEGVELPEAMLLSNNVIALRMMRVLRQKGVDIPERIAIGCIDDVAVAELLDPPLTTVAQPNQEMGRLAMQMLLERIQDPTIAPRERVLPTELVIRRSSLRPALASGITP
jgi:LacI family transcriptional regulator